ncbi:hypothetical protein SADUNF_Sadunf16G0016600 [Salix dunnii]|uniref:Uncharacterized protein n=1 Tax=Salix dunnii TaxID=1413687 RepID=A0A835MFR0_9ROSI|nr:hypothetical protein SADUNF_Sadunf16G0016600 [Salix dunnii]
MKGQSTLEQCQLPTPIVQETHEMIASNFPLLIMGILQLDGSAVHAQGEIIEYYSSYSQRSFKNFLTKSSLPLEMIAEILIRLPEKGTSLLQLVKYLKVIGLSKAELIEIRKIVSTKVFSRVCFGAALASYNFAATVINFSVVRRKKIINTPPKTISYPKSHLMFEEKSFAQGLSLA